LTADEKATLSSLRQIDRHPLYTLQYRGSYRDRMVARATSARPNWACSLFVALGDTGRLVYGRNFDWDHSPAVLLNTNPPDGYASVSMVDIAYLGFAGAESLSLTERPLTGLTALLDAPLIPFDGMNEHGLVVGMAAVPASQAPRDPNRPTIGSLRVIRELLDRARDIDEALGVMQTYNVAWQGGPPVHYLIADALGRALLVEFHLGTMVTLVNASPWHLATNHLRATAEGDAGCHRYARLRAGLEAANGVLTAEQAMSLLADVSQSSTQWSMVYGISSANLDVVMGRRYSQRYSFPARGTPLGE
jgi:hypothetical protein